MDVAQPKYEVINLNSASLDKDLERAKEAGGYIRFIGRGAYTAPDLSCIRDAAWVRQIELYDLVDCDLSAVETLPNLKNFYVNGDFHRSLTVDLSGIASLRNLGVPWVDSIRLPAEDIPIQSLYLSRGREELRELSGWKSLQWLSLFQPKITTLRGVERYAALEHMRLESANRLTSLDCLEKCVHLKHVLVASCRQLVELLPLQQLNELESVRLLRVPQLAVSETLSDLARRGVELRIYPVPRAAKKRNTASRGKSSRRRPVPSDSPAIAALRRSLPTSAWRERMEEGDDTFTTKGIGAAERRLSAFLDQVGGLVAGSIELQAAFRSLVQDFNALNIKYPCLVETMEREELAEFLGAVADTVGFDYEGDDVTGEWRTDW